MKNVKKELKGNEIMIDSDNNSDDNKCNNSYKNIPTLSEYGYVSR